MKLDKEFWCYSQKPAAILLTISVILLIISLVVR